MKQSENKEYCVYVHINKTNDKKYVGLTSKNPEKRWNNGYGYYSNKHFYSAILKYGWDNFQHLIVGEHLSVDEACKMEQDLISLYHSNNPNFGYNICAGGETNILPPSSLKKIADHHRGTKMSESAKALRALHPPKAKKVICDDQEFISITECAKFYDVKPAVMRLWLEGVKSFDCKFKDMNLHIKDAKYVYEECYTKRRWVFYDGKEYKSVSEFARCLHIPPDTVYGWVYGKYRTPQKHLDKGFRVERKKQYIIKYI